MGQLKHAPTSLTSGPIKMRPILLAFIIIVAWSWGIAAQVGGTSAAEHIGSQVVAQYLLGFSIMFAVWRSLSLNLTDKDISLILLTGLIARLVLIFVEPYTSNDVARYLFDGRILLEGIDPYRVAHDAPALQELRAQWQPPAEHAKYPTLYPPLALALYSVSATFGAAHALLMWKVISSLASLSLYFLAYQFLKRTQRLALLPLIALNPLLIFEAGESAHIDVFSALAVMAAIYAWYLQRKLLTGVLIGLGASIKILPMILLLPLWFWLDNTRDRIILVISASMTCLSIYSIALLSGLRPIGSLGVFFAKWRASSPWFHWLEPILDHSGMLIATAIAALLGLLILAIAAYLARNRGIDQKLLILQFSLALPLLISPVVFPWYLLPIAALFSLRPNWPIALWMISLPLSYQVLNQFLCCGVWNPAQWSINVIGVSLIVGVLWSTARARSFKQPDKKLNKTELRRNLC